MPDFSNNASHEFWHEYQDPSIYRVISFMEGVENWTYDGNHDLEQKISELGGILEDVGTIELNSNEEFVQLCACIKTGRCLRILMCLDTAYPGAASKVIMHAENTTKSDTDMAGLFLRRNLVFERLRLLGRVFSKERFEFITKALEESNYD
jgi:intracellular multiplication protein IcmW